MFDSTKILNDDELQALRKRYDEDEVSPQRLALQATAALFPPGRDFVTSVSDVIYGIREPSNFIAPVDREIQLLTLFTISGQSFQLAVHCYWAILIGLSPHDVATTLLLASVTAGIDEYVSAIGVMTKVMHILKNLAPTEPTPEDVLGELQRAFR
jgi:hypothetical protein